MRKYRHFTLYNLFIFNNRVLFVLMKYVFTNHLSIEINLKIKIIFYLQLKKKRRRIKAMFSFIVLLQWRETSSSLQDDNSQFDHAVRIISANRTKMETTIILTKVQLECYLSQVFPSLSLSYFYILHSRLIFFGFIFNLQKVQGNLQFYMCP